MSEERRRIVEAFGRGFESLGTTYNVGRVYGVLMLAERPLAQEDLAETLGISQSVVSTSVRTLETVGMAQKLRVPGSRKSHYEVPLHPVVMFEASIQRRMGLMLGLVGSARALELGPHATARVDEFVEYFEFMRAGMLRLVAEWHAREGE